MYDPVALNSPVMSAAIASNTADSPSTTALTDDSLILRTPATVPTSVASPPGVDAAKRRSMPVSWPALANAISPPPPPHGRRRSLSTSETDGLPPATRRFSGALRNWDGGIAAVSRASISVDAGPAQEQALNDELLRASSMPLSKGLSDFETAFFFKDPQAIDWHADLEVGMTDEHSPVSPFFFSQYMSTADPRPATETNDSSVAPSSVDFVRSDSGGSASPVSMELDHRDDGAKRQSWSSIQNQAATSGGRTKPSLDSLGPLQPPQPVIIGPPPRRTSSSGHRISSSDGSPERASADLSRLESNAAARGALPSQTFCGAPFPPTFVFGCGGDSGGAEKPVPPSLPASLPEQEASTTDQTTASGSASPRAMAIHLAQGAEEQNESQDAPPSSLLRQTVRRDGTPKRPMNAFLIYSRYRRPTLKVERPDLRTAELSSIISKEWRDMSDESRAVFFGWAEQVKRDFNRRWPDYVYTRSSGKKEKEKKKAMEEAAAHASASAAAGLFSCGGGPDGVSEADLSAFGFVPQLSAPVFAKQRSRTASSGRDLSFRSSSSSFGGAAPLQNEFGWAGLGLGARPSTSYHPDALTGLGDKALGMSYAAHTPHSSASVSAYSVAPSTQRALELASPYPVSQIGQTHLLNPAHQTRHVTTSAVPAHSSPAIAVAPLCGPASEHGHGHGQASGRIQARQQSQAPFFFHSPGTPSSSRNALLLSANWPYPPVPTLSYGTPRGSTTNSGAPRSIPSPSLSPVGVGPSSGDAATLLHQSQTQSPSQPSHEAQHQHHPQQRSPSTDSAGAVADYMHHQHQQVRQSAPGLEEGHGPEHARGQSHGAHGPSSAQGQGGFSFC